MTSKRKLLLTTIGITITLLMSIGTLSFFNAIIEGNPANNNIVQQTGTLKITYQDSQTINANNLNPGDYVEKTIKVKNTGSFDTRYELVWETITNNFVDQEELVYQLDCTNCENIIETKVPPTGTNQVIKNDINIQADEEHTYVLRLTFLNLDKPQESNMNVSFYGKISIFESGTYNLEHAITVDIVDEMIPIKWNEDKWVKAGTDNLNNEWYDYENQKWGNSVLVNNESREGYKNADIGTPILEEDILAYYVYVPRYKYQLWNTNHNENCLNDNCAEQEIKIIFETKETTKSTGSQNGQWLTHPAFTFGDTELNGIWVGKFTTTIDPNSQCYKIVTTVYCNKTNNNPLIKPTTDMWRVLQISTMFSVSKKVETEPMYGLTAYDNIDSHMMKNMEWGAVAYLSHSKFGKYGNDDYVGTDKQLYINNYRATVEGKYRGETGCSGGTPDAAQNSDSCPYPYPGLSLEALGASTTGTIYGIYDMSGGVDEYVMGNMVANGKPIGTLHKNTNSGTWDYTPAQKYYDSYAYDTDRLTFGRGYLGDATREVLLEFGTSQNGGWYGDRSRLPYSSIVWMLRGGVGTIGAPAGAFSFNIDGGNAYGYCGFRMVLALE